MTESEFGELVDDTFDALEAALDKLDADLDYENSGSILTVEFDNDTTMVFSRQAPTCQLWLASRLGGFHFTWDETAQDWRGTRDNALFRPFVQEQMQSQAGIDLSW